MGINDSAKKTIMMQFRIATRDALMAARQSFVSVSSDDIETIIVQRCEFDEAAMGTAIPMDAGGVDAHEDVGSLGQRGVGPGLGKGGGYRAPVAPLRAICLQEAPLAGRSTTSIPTTASHRALAAAAAPTTTSGTTARQPEQGQVPGQEG